MLCMFWTENNKSMAACMSRFFFSFKFVYNSTILKVIMIHLCGLLGKKWYQANLSFISNANNINIWQVLKILEPFVFLTQLWSYFLKLREMAKTSIIHGLQPYNDEKIIFIPITFRLKNIIYFCLSWTFFRFKHLHLNFFAA